MKRNISKLIFRVLIVFVALFVTVGVTNVKAAIGYTYSHDGKAIHSSVGFSVTSDGIFNVLSDAWNGKISATDFNSPTDLFYYKDDNGLEQVYVVDNSSNKLFIFDGSMRYQKTYTKFEVDPSYFTNTQISTFKTKSGTTSTYLTTKYKSESNIDLYVTAAEARKISYEYRTEDQKFYIECLSLSGVYRSIRPLRNSDNTVVEGQYQDLLYLCDTGNNQVLVLDAQTMKVVQIISTPTDSSFQGKTFRPTKLVTDGSGRLYVISEGVYEGIMLMNFNGNFMRYVGVNYISLTFWEAFKRNFATETQRNQMTDFLNANFQNLTMDDQGFIYTVSYAATDPQTGAVKDDTAMIKRINQAGKDVLTRNGYAKPKGDLITIRTGSSTDIGSSMFKAIAVNEFGVYTVADSRNGRLFTYDDEGNLLYISAGKGADNSDIIDDLVEPVAVRYQGENVLVLDRAHKTVLRYEPTEIAKKINSAVEYHYNGDTANSSKEWLDVIRENPNYELAYVGVGKTLLTDERYQEAMYYFELGYNVQYYSKAYKLYRDDIIKKYFPYAMSIVLVLVGLKIALVVYKSVKGTVKKKEDGEFYE